MTQPVVATPAHFVAGVSFDEATLADRRTRLGASEVAAVLGLNPYRSPLDVWLEKRGIARSFQGNEFTEWGLRLEPVIRAKFAELRNVDISQPGCVVHDSEPWASCTPDGICEPRVLAVPFGLEMKNKSARQAIKWGESGTDQIPHDVAAQVHFSMLVTRYELWSVAVLFGGNEFRTYDIPADPEIGATIMDECRDFWFKYVVPGKEPPLDASKSAADYLRQKFALHGEAVRDATREEDALIAELSRSRVAAKNIEEAETLLKHRLMDLIGHDAGIVGRSGRITWKRTKDAALVDWQAVATEDAARIAILAEFFASAETRALLGDTADKLARELATAHTDAVQHFTTVREGSRRFLPTFPKE